jgi:hypothetical protein
VKKKALDTLHDELRVVMNHDDYAPLVEEAAESEDDLHSRIASRKEIHRRRPRSSAHRGEAIEIDEVKAA